jgi:serine/threonine protein kinase
MLVGRESIFKLCDFGICGTLKDSVSSTHLGSMRYLPVRYFIF